MTYTGVFINASDEGERHEGLANALLVIIGVHVFAVVITSLLTRDNLVRAFITGTKRGALYPGVADARPPRYR